MVAPGRTLQVCGYGLVVAVLPYAVLKVLWLAGVMVGVPASSPAFDGFAAANAVTLALDAVAALVGLALARRWGLRLPAWLVLVPAWLGVGWLAPTAIPVAAGFVHGLVVAGRPVAMANGLVEPWTYAVVYASFAVQGVLLALGFAAYAHARWGGLLQAGTDALPPARTVGLLGCALALPVAALQLFQAVAAPAGWHGSAWVFENRLVVGVEGLCAIAAIVGMLGLTGRLSPRWSGRTAAACAFVGSGAMVAWPLAPTLATLLRAPLADATTPIEGILDLVSLLGGLVIAMTGLFAVVLPCSVLRAWPPPPRAAGGGTGTAAGRRAGR